MKKKPAYNCFASLMYAGGYIACSLFAVQAVYYVFFIFNGLPGYSLTFSGIASMLFSFFTLLLVASALGLLIFHRTAAYIVTALSVFLVWGMSAYHLNSGSPLDFSLVRDNIGISLSAESFSVICTSFSPRDYILLAVFAACLFFAERKLSFTISVTERKAVAGRAVALLLWILIVVLPYQSGDEFTLFMKSALAYNDNTGPAMDLPGGYPYFRSSIPHTDFSYSVPSAKMGKPYVFLIMIESFNANFVGAIAPDGKEYTPVFNSLIKKGLYVDRFYGNSIQTCKGQEAVFFSIIPAYKGKLFVDYPGLNIKGFPEVLAGAGYETIFFQAYHDLGFDNTYENMVKAGFSVVKSFEDFRRKEDRPYIWGWGVEDGVFYERFFEMLDRRHAEVPDRAVFAALATVGTHIPCDGMPPEKMTIYKKPKEIREKYSNALRLSDSQLQRFFELLGSRDYLKNSIVIITSDHSFPMKEHGVYNNEKCFYDEAFRIPFLVIWDGVISPRRISDRVASQIDIGPTIADMLGISAGENNMTGTSVFDRSNKQPVYLVQPYNGRYLQVVDYPFKYILHVQSRKEYLFNLEKDPSEKFNLIAGEKERAARMRDSVGRIHANQKLIDENRICPVK